MQLECCKADKLPDCFQVHSPGLVCYRALNPAGDVCAHLRFGARRLLCTVGSLAGRHQAALRLQCMLHDVTAANHYAHLKDSSAGTTCMMLPQPCCSAHFETAAGATPILGDATLAGVDSRPSDALNLALRFGAPIYVHRQVSTQLCCLKRGASKALQAMPGLPIAL